MGSFGVWEEPEWGSGSLGKIAGRCFSRGRLSELKKVEISVLRCGQQVAEYDFF